MERTPAVVIRLVPWSETSYVVTLFTRRWGKVEAVAKGARRHKNPYDTAMELLACCEVVLIRKPSEALDVLTEAKLSFRFRPPGRHLENLYAAYYLAEMLQVLTQPDDPHQKLFDLAQQVLQLWRCEPINPWMVFRWETAALKLLGHCPSLGRCVECGRSLVPRGTGTFAPVHGGVLCVRCRRGRRPLVALSAPSWKAWLVMAQEPLEAVLRTEPLSFGRPGEIRAVMNLYLSHLRGSPWRMHRFLPPAVPLSSRKPGRQTAS